MQLFSSHKTASQTTAANQIEEFPNCAMTWRVSTFYSKCCTFWEIAWNISQILTNELAAVDKSFADLWAERGSTETLTSSRSVLHVDVQKNPDVELSWPSVSVYFAWKRSSWWVCGSTKPLTVNLLQEALVPKYYKAVLHLWCGHYIAFVLVHFPSSGQRRNNRAMRV